MLRADSAKQDEVLHEWQAELRDITKVIRDMLLYIYNMDAAPSRIRSIVNPAFFEIAEDDRLELAAGFRAHAAHRNRPFADFMLDCLAQWQFDPAIITDRSSLMISVRRFDRLVNGDDPPPDPIGSGERQSGSKPKTRRRSAASVVRAKPSEASHLAFRQVESIYAMASFLPQQHGVLLNTKLDIYHSDFSALNGKTPPVVSALTHALALRTNEWASTPAHWLYVNAREDDGLRTRIALHLPPEALGKVGRWLEDWKANASEAKAAGAIEFALDAQKPNRAEGYDHNRIQRHWYIFRWLAGGLDPFAQHWPHEDARGEREAVVDLLKIGPEMRYSIGVLGRMNAIGSSRSLAPISRKRAAEDRMGFLSAFEDCAWSRLQEGWELKEYGDRVQELIQRQEAVERLELEYPPGSTRLEQDAHEIALKRLVDSWPEDPRKRARSWQGWWSD